MRTLIALAIRCASRFDPLVPQPGARGLRKKPVRTAVPRVLAPHMVMTALRDEGPASASPSAVLHGEFDPGSGRTLAACLTHASGATNRGLPRGRAANG